MRSIFLTITLESIFAVQTDLSHHSNVALFGVYFGSLQTDSLSSFPTASSSHLPCHLNLHRSLSSYQQAPAPHEPDPRAQGWPAGLESACQPERGPSRDAGTAKTPAQRGAEVLRAARTHAARTPRAKDPSQRIPRAVGPWGSAAQLLSRRCEARHGGGKGPSCPHPSVGA